MMTSMSPHHVRRFGDVEEHISPGIVDSGENWDAENHATRAIVIDRLVTLSGVVEPVIDVRKLDPCACPRAKSNTVCVRFLTSVSISCLSSVGGSSQRRRFFHGLTTKQWQ